MRILVVSPYPPVRDGIGTYAVQSVARLRAEGHDVEVLSPGPSAAHHHLDLVGPRGALALAKRVRGYDKVIVQFHPDVFFPRAATPWQWRMESLALFVAFRCAREVEVRLHEIDYSRGGGGRAVRFMNRLPWHAVDRVVVHTEIERDAFSRAYGVGPERIAVTAHGADFRRSTSLTKVQARASLGLPGDDIVFLNIGFIQPHKGFDRSVRAISQMRAGGIGGRYRLDIVGSVRTPEPAYLAYLHELSGLVDGTTGAFLHDGYVSDELFDRWLVACDVVVLPYRSIWSSSVIERALLYDRPVIATDVGGLSFQTAERDRVTMVDDDIGLRRAMTEVVLARAGDTATGLVTADPDARAESWADSVAVDRETVQGEIRRRAAARRQASERAWPGADRGPVGAPVASAPLRDVLPLVLAEPASDKPGVRGVKRVLGRLLAWEIDPLVDQVNALRSAAIEALDADDGSPGPRRAGEPRASEAG